MGNYLGRGLDKISNIEVLDNITFDGSSSYSITKGSVAFTPNSAQSCLISIDGVVQATNFSVNSSNIDFGVAIPSTSVCNFFLHYGTGLITVPSDGSVTESKIGSNAVSSAKMFSGFKNGITMIDQWRIIADTNSGTDADITSNWERADDATWSGIGTGLTESSGIFSFPQTGIYLISSFFGVLMTSDAGAGVVFMSTNDNSTYSADGRSYEGTNSLAYGSLSFQNIIDVQDTSNYKFKFATTSFASGSHIKGSTLLSQSSFIATRIGDT